MAITIKSNIRLLKEQDALLIILKNIESNKVDYHQENDFIFIFSHNQLVGINIFNHQKYFLVNPGFHLITKEIKQYLLNHWSKYVKESDFQDLFKIGEVIEIKNHQSIEKLKILKVRFNDQERQIITNYSKVALNKKYLFALDGATLASGLQISESKVASTLSQGMILSYQSLGINQEGIIECEQQDISD